MLGTYHPQRAVKVTTDNESVVKTIEALASSNKEIKRLFVEYRNGHLSESELISSTITSLAVQLKASQEENRFADMQLDQ